MRLEVRVGRRGGTSPVCVAAQLDVTSWTCCESHLLPLPAFTCLPACKQPMCRRAHRLRVLVRLLESPVSQRALTRFWKGTLLVCAIILVAHVVCYTLLGTQVLERHS